MKSNNLISFKLYGINTEQFAYVDDVEIDDEKIALKSGIDYGIAIEDKLVACFIKIEFSSKDKMFLKLQMDCEFEIQEESWNSIIDEDKISFPVPFVKHLGVITVGSARGVLHAKTENTKFNKYFLPTINLHEIIKKPVVFNLK